MQNKRSIANAIQIFFKDGSYTEKIEVQYPIGHLRRREESLPFLFKKFEENAATLFSSSTVQSLITLFKDKNKLEAMPVNEFMDLFCQ